MIQNQPRITSGSLKGRKLKVPASARPFTERVKITMFDLISEYIEGAKVLDLFAGSGNLGIEALSRGAEYVQFIENDPEAVKVIYDNLKHLELGDRTRVTSYDVFKFIGINKENFDLVFIDPPFTLAFRMDFSDIANFLTDDGLVILKLEEGNDKFAVDGLALVYSKKVGTNVLYFYKKVKNDELRITNEE